ncbi:transglycosylase domain-containing protein [Pseudonocardia aurantiaca]|uniref:Transglycosylase domain-containing protein n=1 Tax=Pseudonocardia aurantiaca TaxID=75290 RepID=A0ABW4FBZ1_9PSEU
MPLLTHEETGAASVARGHGGDATRAGGVALAERPPPGIEPRRSRHSPAGRKAAKATDGKPPTLWRRIRKWVYIALGMLVMGPFIAFVLGWIFIPVPTSDEAAVAQVARFTFADGTTELATLRPAGTGDERINRESVTLDQVPENVRRAVLSAEDRSFYSNPGFDFMGIGRAVFNQLTGGVGGGSTITQQYVKVSTGQDDISLWRKYREVVLAVKISREQTKDQILENYLNTIPFGRGAYGIQAASKAYFKKPVQDLTVSEGAMLAGLIQAPSAWDPAKNLDRSQVRWNFVLDGMVEQGWLDASERAQQVFPTDWQPTTQASTGMPGDDRYHIYERAMAELASHGITEEQINTLGLTINTTIQQPQQAQAVDAINNVMKGQPENLREALVSIDPRTGAIVAYYGGSQGLAIDYAGEAVRQPGSSFKPFVLTAALQAGNGVGLGSIYDGRSGQVFVPGGAPVDNSEGVDCNQCDVKYAMTKSINTVFYKMALDTGLRKVIDAAHSVGIPNDVLDRPATGGIALGDQEVHPIDMASAFATFAADGVYRQPYIVSKVTAADGRVLYQHETNEGEQRIPQQVARNVTESMLDVARSSSFPLDGGRAVAAKTGTVQQSDTGSDNKDAWTVGYTPSLSTAVWLGTDTSEAIRDSRNRPIYGRMLPGQMWQEFMNSALQGTPKESFSRFVPMGTPPTGYGSGEQTSGSVATSTPPTSSQDSGNNNNNDNSNNGNSNNNGNNNNNGSSNNNNGSSNNNNNNRSGRNSDSGGLLSGGGGSGSGSDNNG